MKLNKLQINGFGNIENKEIELEGGLNLICGKNETGKSTMVNFIKGIFYGVNRNKAGNEFSEYELFKPWGNADFSGKMEYELDGKQYTVFRDFNRNNCKVYDKDGTDITADFSKDIMTNNNNEAHRRFSPFVLHGLHFLPYQRLSPCDLQKCGLFLQL